MASIVCPPFLTDTLTPFGFRCVVIKDTRFHLGIAFVALSHVVQGRPSCVPLTVVGSPFAFQVTGSQWDRHIPFCFLVDVEGTDGAGLRLEDR